MKQLILIFCLVPSVFAASHQPALFLQSLRGQNNEGEQIVQHFCATCHAIKPLILIGAPRIGVKEDWESRVQKGLRGLFKTTESGLNAMPPRGGCFECSDEQLMLAIMALLPKKGRPPSVGIDLKDLKKNR